MVNWQSDFVEGNSDETAAVQLHTTVQIAIDLINNGTYPTILPNTALELYSVDDFLSSARAIKATIDFVEQGYTLITGYHISAIAVPTATVGTVYEVAQLSGLASSHQLSNDREYPYFSRIASVNAGYSYGLKDTIVHYQSQTERGWSDVAVISTISEFTTTMSTIFIEAADPEINVLTYQQFLSDADNIDVELGEVAKSGARIIVALVFGDWEGFIAKADEFGLVGDSFVWFVPSTVCGFPFSQPSALTRGAICPIYYIPEDSPELTSFIDVWRSLDPEIYPAAGPGTTPSTLSYLAYDMVIAAAMAIDEIERAGQIDSFISATQWSEVIRNLTFEGVSGSVSFRPDGDRIGDYSIRYYIPETNSWKTSGIWSFEEGYEQTSDVVWYSNSTELPDLDIRPAFDYWSCDNKELRHDETGKTIQLHTPGSSAVDDIDSAYHCDQFIDCQNLSDESYDCNTNFTIVFIVFGIVTGLFISLSVCLFVFVLVFGVWLKYRRLRTASPFFLLLLLASVIVGYTSVYAWFGKPHPVACGFQPWLLGLSVIAMITALSVKNFRIWRIFRFPTKKIRISNFELFVLWTIIMLPGVLILVIWSIVSTPTATLVSIDGREHYVCATGGFTGPPGGYIFFAIFVAYSGLILVVGGLISFATRKVPSQFNETKLLTISIYNLLFLSIVIIPVFLVVNPYDPFIAWILRTVAILYAFTATLMVQFLPILFGIFITDKGRNVKQFKSKINMAAFESTPKSSTSADSSQPSANSFTIH